MLRMRGAPSGGRLGVLLVCSGLALAAPGFATHAGAAAKNLLVNPGFEELLKGHPWMPSGWDTSRAGTTSAFFGRDTLLVHGGKFAVSVANASGLFPMAHNWSQTLLLGREAWGKDLVFSVWTRSLAVEGRAYVLVQAFQDTITKMSRVWDIERDDAGRRLRITGVDDPVLDLGWKRQFFSEPETDWVRREVRVFVPPSVNVVFVRCGLLGTGQVFVDDASLTLEPALPSPEPPLKTNLLADPGFEGDGNAWEYSLPPYPNMRADRDTSVVHSGTASLRMSSMAGAMVPGKAGVCQVLSNRNFAGKRLRFSGYIKTDSLRSTAYLKLYCHTPRGAEAGAATKVFSGTMDWGLATLDMDAPLDTYEIWIWFTYNAPTRGRVYFDDASLEVLGPAGSQ